MIKAKPIYYEGRLYRSTLEAKWKAFFNILGWQSEYEPCTFHGWIPDFAIYGSRTVYVEIKPFTSYCPYYKELSCKVENSGIWEKHYSRDWMNDIYEEYIGPEVLLIGSLPILAISSNYADGLILGILVKDGDLAAWKKHDNGQFDFKGDMNDYDPRLFGGPWKGIGTTNAEIMSLWNTACNQVQWNPPKMK